MSIVNYWAKMLILYFWPGYLLYTPQGTWAYIWFSEFGKVLMIHFARDIYRKIVIFFWWGVFLKSCANPNVKVIAYSENTRSNIYKKSVMMCSVPSSASLLGFWQPFLFDDRMTRKSVTFILESFPLSIQIEIWNKRLLSQILMLRHF